jgi:hypothetical protein
MAFLLGAFEGDYDAYKQMFDADPLGRKEAAKGHALFRSVDNPNLIFVRVEFDSEDTAREFGAKVRDSNILQNMTIKIPPTVVELADEATY